MSQIFYVSTYASLAAADSAATSAGGVLYIDTNVTLAANTTLSAREVYFAGGIITRSSYTLTCAGVIVAGDTKIFDAAGTGGITTKNGVVNARWFGAVGDGTTDDTNTLIQCQKCCDNSVVGTGASIMRLPLGTYAISAPLPWYGSIVGDGSSSSAIIALSGFSGSYMLDFNYGTEGKQMEGVTWDLRALGSSGTVTAFGSSSAGHGGGSAAGEYRDVTVLSTSCSTFAIKCRSSGVPEAWMFTGARFYGLRISAPLPWDVEIGDDLVLVEPRFHIADHGNTVPCEFLTTNTKIISMYSWVSISDDADSAIFMVGNGVSIDGHFIEGSSNLAWVYMYPSGSPQPISISRVETNLTMGTTSTQKAFIRTNTMPTTRNFGVSIDTVCPVSGPIPCDYLFSIFNSWTGVVPWQLQLQVKGCDHFGDLAKAGVSSSASSHNTVIVTGQFREVIMQHEFTCPAALGSYVGHGSVKTPPSTY
ncbi:MAG TPA: glycosyl hydrolase family 28-related protein [Rhizomicrobium sp.]|nr:glycosyl hydrolase family 28-related protein [Rhizomicrobium sp.]